MARLFDDANSQYYEYGSAILGAVPISMACWFNTDDLTVLEMLMAVTDSPTSSTDTNTFCLYVDGTTAGDPVRAGTQRNTFAVASSSAGPSVNTWAHACGVWAGTNARAAYLNGGNKGTNATNLTPLGLTKTNIGCYYSWTGVMGAPMKFWSGLIAEAGMWNVALTDDEVAILAKGFSPLMVHPENLVAYWPLIGNVATEIDTVGGYGMTPTASAPTKAAHPRVLYPSNHLALSTYVVPPVGGGQVLAYGKYW